MTCSGTIRNGPRKGQQCTAKKVQQNGRCMLHGGKKKEEEVGDAGEISIKKEKPPDDDIGGNEKELFIPCNWFKCVKLPLVNVLNENEEVANDVLDVINEKTFITNTLDTLARDFIKQYILFNIYTSDQFVEPTEDLVLMAMKVVANSSITRRGSMKEENKNLYDELKSFYNNEYSTCQPQSGINYSGLDNSMKYTATRIMTDFENNIKNNYTDYLKRYVSYTWKTKELARLINKEFSDERKKAIKHSLYRTNIKLVTDLLRHGDPEHTRKSHLSYHPWLDQTIEKFFPNRVNTCVAYDLKVDGEAVKYLKSMFSMMKELHDDRRKILKVFPLRTSAIPKHFTLCSKGVLETFVQPTEKDSFKPYKNNQDKIWSQIFNLEHEVFANFLRKGYKFNNMIDTDRVSVSLLFIRKDKYGKRKLKVPKKGNKVEDLYITDRRVDVKRLSRKIIVAIDPGKIDLLYCTDSHGRGGKQMRYSQDQRRRERKQKKYTKIRIREKKRFQIYSKSVEELEKELSNFNSKTLSYEDFKVYLTKKYSVYKKIEKLYRDPLFRKLRLNTYINTQRTEALMLRRFEKKFGKPGEVVICIGDFSRNSTLPNNEPTKGKGFRRLLKRFGYELYLVWEYRTSQSCLNCRKGRCVNTIKRKNPRPWKHNIKDVHGLLRCKFCGNFWNRDVHGSKNIHLIAYNTIHGLSRPTHLTKEHSFSKRGVEGHQDRDRIEMEGQAIAMNGDPLICRRLNFKFSERCHS